MKADLKQMPFLMHLKELRERLLKSLAGIAIGAIAIFVIADTIFYWLISPLKAALPAAQLIGTGPVDAFMVKIHISVLGGFLLSLPLTFYQLWAFVAPGLHDHEKRYALPFVFFTTLFFLAGVIFCFFAVLPAAFGFFMDEYVSIGIEPTIRISEYLSFVFKLLIVFGLTFEMPVLSFLLSRTGIITAEWLIGQTRAALVVIFIAAALLTPGPDVASQLLLAGPMLALYALCIGIAKFGSKRRVIVGSADVTPP